MKLLKVDTRDKKPKLYNLLLQALLPIAVLFLTPKDGAQGNAAVSILFALFFAAAVVQLIVAFVQQIEYNPYSYNTIFYIGFALFFFSAFFSQTVLTVQIIRDPAQYTTDAIVQSFLNSARNYMMISAPFIAVFSFALCSSNLALIRREGLRIVNLLGIVLSFLLLAGEAFLFFDAREGILPTLGGNLFAAIYLYFECMLIGTMIADAIAARYEPEPNRDFLIVLGCGLKQNGTPSPLLQGRLDRALAFDRKQQAETGKTLTFITSGGQGADEPLAESAAMKQYLTEQGVSPDRIIEENRSASTYENMAFSKAIIDAIKPDAKISFSTTNYHVFRSGLFARRVKMRATGVGAKTKWYFWPNAAVREFVGLLTKHRGKQALILGGIAAFYITLTLIYR